MADYLKVFATQADYDAYIAGGYPKPNVSYIEATDETIFTNYADSGADSILAAIAPEDWPSSLTTWQISSAVTEVIVPEGVTVIDSNGFRYYSRLVKITVPSTLLRINSNAFQYTANLKTLNLTNIAEWCNVDLNSTFGHPFQLKTDTHLLLNDTEVTNLNIPSGVTTIKKETFQYCDNITSLTIPESVTSIGERAFQSCSSLASVTVRATTPPTLGLYVFLSTSANLVIYVPAESVETYKAANNWSTYASQIQAIP